MNYIEKLNDMRYKKGFTFRQLGLICELSESAVKKILYNKCTPGIPSLEKLCAALDTSLPEIFCDSDKIIIKKTDEIIALIAGYYSLPTEAQILLFQFVNMLCNK